MLLKRYGQPFQTISFPDLMALQKEHGMLWAHAEDSGCESCYCEVAHWNNTLNQWQRFCHIKCQDVRLPDMPLATDEETAIELARLINEPLGDKGRTPLVHRMPDYKE